MSVGESREATFLFTNAGDMPQSIESVLFAGPVVCNFTCPVGILEPGESVELRVEAACEQVGEYEEDAPLLINQSENYVLPVWGYCG